MHWTKHGNVKVGITHIRKPSREMTVPQVFPDFLWPELRLPRDETFRWGQNGCGQVWKLSLLPNTSFNIKYQNVRTGHRQQGGRVRRAVRMRNVEMRCGVNRHCVLCRHSRQAVHQEITAAIHWETTARDLIPNSPFISKEQYQKSQQNTPSNYSPSGIAGATYSWVLLLHWLWL